VAGGHHTQTRGSLIVIDPSVADDGAMSQIRRFIRTRCFQRPRARSRMTKRPARIASPWPLGEKLALCVYDPLASAQYGYIDWRARARYAIALVDAYGNKETLYTHPEIRACRRSLCGRAPSLRFCLTRRWSESRACRTAKNPR
jgi:hypothetical protein